MVETNEEQKEVAEETKTPYVSEDKETSQVAETKVSNEAEATKEEEGEATETEPKVVPLVERPEFQQAVARAVQSEADKRSVTYQRELREAKAETARVKAEAQRREEDARITALQGAATEKWKSAGIEDKDIDNIHNAYNWNRQKEAELKSKEIEMMPKIKDAETYDAVIPALKEVLSDDVFGIINALTEAVKEGETPREKMALARLKIAELKAKPKSEPKKPEPETQEERNKPSNVKPAGLGQLSDVAFKAGIGDGSLPLNKANLDRARNLGLI